MLSSFTTECVDKLCTELKKPEHMDKMHQSIVHPILKYSLVQMSPFFVTILVLLIILVILNIMVTVQIYKAFKIQV